MNFIQKLHDDKQRYAKIVSDQLNETAHFLAQLKEHKPQQQEAEAEVQPQDDWLLSTLPVVVKPSTSKQMRIKTESNSQLNTISVPFNFKTNTAPALNPFSK